MVIERVREIELAERLGVSREVVRRVRQELREGEHWVQEHRFVELTPDGVEAVREALRARKETPPRMERPEGEARVIEELRVTRIFPRNPRILEAETAAGARVRVRVRSNVNFILGMAIPCREMKSGLWCLTRACPRFKGRW